MALSLSRKLLRSLGSFPAFSWYESSKVIVGRSFQASSGYFGSVAFNNFSTLESSIICEGLNVYSILLHDTLVMTRDAVNRIVERMHTPINR